MRQYAEEVILSYDSDAAGQKAIMRGIDIMQSLGVPVRILQMEGAKDPDEYVLKFGKEKFEKLINNSISPVDYKVGLLQKEYDFSDTTQKINFLTEMANILAKVTNNIERDVYVDKYSRELNVGKEAIIAEVEKRTIRDNNINNKNWKTSNKIKSNTQISKVDDVKLEKMIIYLLTLKDIDIFNKLKKVYTDDDIKASNNKLLIEKLYNLYETGDINNKDLMSVCETDEENNLLSEALMQSNVRDDTSKYAEEIIRNIEGDKLQVERKDILKKMQENITEDEKRLLMTRLNEINFKLARK